MQMRSEKHVRPANLPARVPIASERTTRDRDFQEHLDVGQTRLLPDQRRSDTDARIEGEDIGF